nr:hypothetical protein [Mammaliicoccus sp. Marseille-Q6498]
MDTTNIKKFNNNQVTTVSEEIRTNTINEDYKNILDLVNEISTKYDEALKALVDK